jgi:hypothetical protein
MNDSANPARRPTQVAKTITLNGTDFRLIYDFNAVAALEDLYDKPLKRIATENLGDKENLRIRDIERLICAGMLADRPDMTVEKVRAILNEAVAAGADIEQVMTDAFGAFDASAGDDTDGKSDPRTPTAG